MDSVTLYRIGILGAGTMGMQIALLCASRGMKVSLWNHSLRPDFEKTFRRMASVQTKLGTLSKENAEMAVSNVDYVCNMEMLQGCSIVIEAVTENLEIKHHVLKNLGIIADTANVIATNTSTLSITALASIFPEPQKFVGIHFFNPPLSMELVEIVRGEHTSDETVTMVLQFLASLGKQPVVLPETPGFVVNRLLFPMINEAIFLLAEGISDARTIDNCMKMGAHHPMGPLELADLIGLDTCLSILETLVTETGDGKYRPAPLLKKYVRAGKLGKKSGSGFYSYRKKG